MLILNKSDSILLQQQKSALVLHCALQFQSQHGMPCVQWPSLSQNRIDIWKIIFSDKLLLFLFDKLSEVIIFLFDQGAQSYSTSAAQTHAGDHKQICANVIRRCQ